MRALCNDCGETIAIAHQFAPAIKAARARRDVEKARQRTTVRVSRPLADFAASQLLGRGANPDRLDLMLKTFVSMAFDKPARRTEPGGWCRPHCSPSPLPLPGGLAGSMGHQLFDAPATIVEDVAHGVLCFWPAREKCPPFTRRHNTELWEDFSSDDVL